MDPEDFKQAKQLIGFTGHLSFVFKPEIEYEAGRIESSSSKIIIKKPD